MFVIIPFRILWSGADKYPQETNNLPIVNFVQFINKFFATQVVNIHNFSSFGQDLLFSLFVKCPFSFAFMGTSSLKYTIIYYFLNSIRYRTRSMGNILIQLPYSPCSLITVPLLLSVLLLLQLVFVCQLLPFVVFRVLFVSFVP